MIKAVSNVITLLHQRRRPQRAAAGLARERGSLWTLRALQNADAQSLSEMTYDQLVRFIATA